MRHFNKRDIRMKEVRLLECEHDKLQTAQFNLGYIQLAKPLRDGWIKHLELREDISRRKDANVIEEVLEATGVKIWGRDKKHADKNWIHKHRFDRSILHRGIERIDKKEFSKLSPKAKKWFEKRRTLYRYSYRSSFDYCSLVPRYYYKDTYTRAYITHRKIIDSEIEQRMQEIEELLLSDKYYQYSGFGGRRSRPWIKHTHKALRRKDKVYLRSYDLEEILLAPLS